MFEIFSEFDITIKGTETFNIFNETTESTKAIQDENPICFIAC